MLVFFSRLWISGLQVQCVYVEKIHLCVILWGSLLYWLCVLPSRAWFNAAFVNVGQNTLWTALSPPLSFSSSLSVSLSFSHLQFFVSFIIFLSTPQFLLSPSFSLCISYHFPLFLSLTFSLVTAYNSLPLHPSLFLFVCIAATYSPVYYTHANASHSTSLSFLH